MTNITKVHFRNMLTKDEKNMLTNIANVPFKNIVTNITKVQFRNINI